MDKIRQQKLEYFLLDLDGKIKEIKDYLLLDKGALLLEDIDKFEEENAEFLQYNPAGQDELNKRKWIIQYVIFPIIADDKVEELLQYHLLEALSVGLDLEELMKMRAISISELLWPKLSQQYLKALMQNTQLIGSNPISVGGEKTSYLPYVKNWISMYNKRFGIEKHTGLEPHQFVLEDSNAQKLGKSLKESLLKVLRFYESMKVYSLSEIEGELRKMQMGFAAQQAAAYSVSKDQEKGPAKYPGSDKPRQPAGITHALPNEHVTSLSKNKSPEKISAIQKEILEDKRIKIVASDRPFFSDGGAEIKEKSERKSISGSNPKEVERKLENSNIQDLLDKYPVLQTYKLTNNSISLPIAPFSLSPTIQNWIQYYSKECGRGKHSPQERESFLERLRQSQNLGSADIQSLQKIFLSVDEKTPLPFDAKNSKLLLDLVKVGEKLKTEEKLSDAAESPRPDVRLRNLKISKPAAAEEDKGYLNLELVPAGKNEDEPNLKFKV